MISTAKKSRKKFKLSKSIFMTIGFILLLIYALSFLTPLFWAILTSLKSNFDFSTNLFGLPKKWMFSNYKTVFEILTVTIHTPEGSIKYYLTALFLNSIVYATGCALLHTFVPCVCAYVVAKYKYKFSKFVYGIVVVTMLLPTVGNLPSQITVLKMIGLFDSLIGIFVMRASFLGINFLIFYGAFNNISWEYAEAGFIDGASHFSIMVKIMMPLIRPTINAILLLSFISYWNEYYVPMIFLPSMPTVALGVYKFAHSTDNIASSIPMKMTGCILVALPILALFLAFKNKLMGNIAVGGLKG